VFVDEARRPPNQAIDAARNNAMGLTKIETIKNYDYDYQGAETKRLRMRVSSESGPITYLDR
jgi:hypothetical protein